ncbi:MAG: glutathione S-transferase, partial [Rhodobacteraceae bacterium]|nr:glutathione S-transferase [Paracoccaceae bacterium]
DEYILPSGFSAVDVAVSYGAMIGSRFVSLEGLPRVRAWLARLAARPAFGRALARDGVSQIYTREFYPAPEVSHG